MNRQLELGRGFWVDVQRDGVLLLDTPGSDFVEPRPMSADVAVTEASAYAAEAFEFVERRREALAMEMARGLSPPGWRKDAAFTAHQISEQLYHGLLMVFTLYIPKSHNLIFLRKRTDELDERLREVWPASTKLEKRAFELLWAAYVKARYSPHYRVTSEELDWIASRVALLQQIVTEACEARLAAMAAGTSR